MPDNPVDRERIRREIRHAHATRWPEGDSWIRGYAEDCAALLDALEAAERERDDRAEDAIDRSLEYLRVTADLQAAEARVVLLEAQRDEAVEELRNAKASLASGPLRDGYAYMVIGRVIDALAAVSVADSGPAPEEDT